jgi:hypothetical protein
VFLVLAPWWPSQESDWTEIWSVSYSYVQSFLVNSSSGWRMTTTDAAWFRYTYASICWYKRCLWIVFFLRTQVHMKKWLYMVQDGVVNQFFGSPAGEPM